MKRRTPQQLDQWLKAEAEGRTVEADRECRSAFLQLPAAALPAGMTDRLVSAVVAALPRRRDPFLRPGVRAAIAASFLLAAVIAAGLPAVLASAGGRLRVGHVIDLLQASLATASSLAASVPGLWSRALDLARLGSGAASSPAMLLCLTLLAGVSLVTFRLLTEIASRQKELLHVDAI